MRLSFPFDHFHCGVLGDLGDPGAASVCWGASQPEPQGERAQGSQELRSFLMRFLTQFPLTEARNYFTAVRLSGDRHLARKCWGQSTYACWCQHERFVRHSRLDRELRVFLVWYQHASPVWPLVIHLTDSTMPRAPAETKGTLCPVAIYGEHTGRTPRLGRRCALYPDVSSSPNTKQEPPWLLVTPLKSRAADSPTRAHSSLTFSC